MTTGQTSEVIQHLRRTVLLRDGAGLTDGQLLEDFLSRQEGAALAALVRRHGPMVWGVCRRVLRNPHDAEDAFQATFLVLVRKAASVMPREMVANWLYGVAHQTALKARATAAKRRTRERQVTEMPEPAVAQPDLWRDLQPLLDLELSRLPDRYRVVVVLCDLEGRTRKEAARQLGVPEGTVAGRLARARAMLAKRLARHGLAVSGGALAAVLARDVAAASVPTSVLSSTIKAATRLATGPAAAAGLISVTAAALAEAAGKTASPTKLQVATALFLAAGVLASTTSLGRLPLLAVEPPPPQAARPATQDGGKRPTAPKPVVVREDAYVTRLAWRPDGKVVAAVGVNYERMEVRDRDGKNPQRLGVPFSTVKLWDARTGNLKQSPGAEKAAIHDLAFSPVGRTAAVVVFKLPEKIFSRWLQKAGEPPPDVGKQEVRIVDAETWALKRTVQVEGGILQAVAFSPDGKTLAIGGNSDRVVGGSYVKLWDVQGETMKGGTKFAARTVMAVRDGEVYPLAYSPEGQVLAAGDRHGQLRLFDGQTGEVKHVWEPHEGAVRGIAFAPDGQTLVSVGQDKTVKLWDVPTGKPRRTLQGNKGSVAAVAFSPDGNLLATGGTVKEDGKSIAEVILWDTKTWEVKQTLPDQTVVVSTLAFSPDGKTLAIGSGRSQDDGGKATGEIKLLRLE
jgi:RNA polymerase sigma factor (sigma-70 family)